MRMTIRRSQVWKDGLDNWVDAAMDNKARIVSEATKEVFELATTTQPSVKQTGGAYQIGAIALDTMELWKSQRVTVNGTTVAEGPGSPEGVPDRITQRTNVSLWFDAPHARLFEYGNGQYEGRLYVHTAKEQWLRLVDEAAARMGV